MLGANCSMSLSHSLSVSTQAVIPSKRYQMIMRLQLCNRLSFSRYVYSVRCCSQLL